jgi:hypothetical protein
MVRYLGVVFTNLQPVKSKLILPAHLQERAGNNYAFSLDDLASNPHTNPQLRRGFYE